MSKTNNSVLHLHNSADFVRTTNSGVKQDENGILYRLIPVKREPFYIRVDHINYSKLQQLAENAEAS